MSEKDPPFETAAEESTTPPEIPPRVHHNSSSHNEPNTNITEVMKVTIPKSESTDEVPEDIVSPLPAYSPAPASDKSSASVNSHSNLDGTNPTTPSPSGSVRSKKPLPKYTSIDLENELPHIFNTSLNPNLHDPDMTMFFSSRGPPYHNYKKASPPPSYRSSRASFSPPSSIHARKLSQSSYRHQMCFFLFFIVFVICPLLILLIWQLLPDVIITDSNRPVVELAK